MQGTFLKVWIQPPDLIKPTQHQTENDHQRDQSQTLFFFLVFHLDDFPAAGPINW